MRLLLVNRALPEHVAGGLERHFEDLARGLAAAGHEVHLLTATLPGEAARAAAARLAAAGLRWHALAGPPAGRYSLAWMLRAGRRIGQLEARFHFDLIHAQEFAAGLWRPRAGGAAFALTVHGTITSETPLHRDVYPLLPAAARPAACWRYGRRFLFAPAWRRSLLAAGRVLADSAFTRGELARLYPSITNKISVVPLGVPWAGEPVPGHAAAREALGWGDGTPRLLTLGRLEWAKGQDLALEALAGLRGLDWHYVIAGEGSWRGRIERQIAQTGLRERVTLLGRVEAEQIRLLLAGADLFLWPERTHPAFGLVGLEAHLANTPVLANRRGAIPESLGTDAGAPGAWLCEAPTPAAFRERLAPLLSEPARLAAARAGLRERAQARFSYSQMIQGTLAAYGEALARR